MTVASDLIDCTMVHSNTYIFKQDYILVTSLSIKGVSGFVVGPRMRNFSVTTACPESLLISAYLLSDFLFHWTLIWVSVSDKP